MKEDLSPITAIPMSRFEPPRKPLILKRNWVVFFCFSGCFIDFLLRFNLSVAMVEIVKEQVPCRNQTLPSTTPIVPNVSDAFTDKPVLSSDRRSEAVRSPDGCYENKYDYDKYWTGQFLAAYFYGLFG